jgi:hypothetical protein
MSTSDFRLAPTPTSERERELWLQHAAGFILFEDVRAYAIARIDPKLDEVARDAARRAVDDALYGLMQVIDGVSAGLEDGPRRVHLDVSVLLVDSGKTTSVRLADGDGMCMGIHGWREGDYGSSPVAGPTK